MRKFLSAAILCTALVSVASTHNLRMDSYCNPLNVDYTYMIYNSANNISYRSGADPAVVEFRGEYYMAQGGLSVADGCRCLTKELDMIAC